MSETNGHSPKAPDVRTDLAQVCSKPFTFHHSTDSCPKGIQRSSKVRSCFSPSINIMKTNHFRDRGEEAATALETKLSNIESRIEDMLASMSENEKAQQASKHPEPSNAAQTRH